MSKRKNLTVLSVLLVVSSGVSTFAGDAVPSPAGRNPHFSFVSRTLAVNDREQDGLQGPVRRVKTETVKLTVKNGKPVEGARAVLETTTYDNKGNKVDNAYFLAAGGSLTGKEVYKYDDKGNMVEMTLHNDDGSLLSKEVYTYEFDAVGNWTKMTTSVAVIEGGKVSFEPSEITYRTIAYYLEEAMLAKMSQPAPPPAAAAAAAPAVAVPAPATSNPKPNEQANAKQNTAAPSNVSAVPSSTATAKTVTPPPAEKKTSQKVAAPLLVAPPQDKSAVAMPSTLAAAGGTSMSAVGGPVVKSDGEAPAARPVVKGPLKPVSGGILNGKAVSLPTPTYPEVAKRAHSTGVVEVQVVIDISGKVISAKAVGGPVLLRDAAEKAALQAKFSPTLLSGQPVKVAGVITYNFSMGR
jgi:protein TonB